MINRLPLDSGERLIWAGRPQSASYALKKGALTFLFGIPFFAFAVFWTYTASSGPTQGPIQFFWIWGLPFLAVGLGLVLSPGWYFLRAGRTTYTLTSRRAVIDSSGPFARRLSLPLEQIPFVELQGGAGGVGHVLFREVAVSNRNNGMPTKDGFIAIPDAEKVDRLLRDSIAKLRSHPAVASK